MSETIDVPRTSTTRKTNNLSASNTIQKSSCHYESDMLTFSIGYGKSMETIDKIGVLELQPATHVTRYVSAITKSKHSDQNTTHQEKLTITSLWKLSTLDWNIFDQIPYLDTYAANANASTIKSFQNLNTFLIIFLIYPNNVNIKTYDNIIGSMNAWLFIDVIDSLNYDQYQVTLKAKKLTNRGALTFIESNTTGIQATILDDISTVLLKRGLICIDVADIRSVMSNQLSIGLHYSCKLDQATSRLGELVQKHLRDLSASSGVFIVFSFFNGCHAAIRYIDELATIIKNVVPLESRLFFSAHLSRKDNDFGCTLIFNRPY